MPQLIEVICYAVDPAEEGYSPGAVTRPPGCGQWRVPQEVPVRISCLKQQLLLLCRPLQRHW
jgi:hypothetical protein